MSYVTGMWTATMRTMSGAEILPDADRKDYAMFRLSYEGRQGSKEFGDRFCGRFYGRVGWFYRMNERQIRGPLFLLFWGVEWTKN